ncbi:Putative transcriptional regulator (fragment) [Phycicoccus elongatus Lp2]|uniref:Putative transcriptional regulator n=1 Tax=Phycicoccus elongatus Lp2 TaxID=1193181 RepID=N0E1K4_9MICO
MEPHQLVTVGRRWYLAAYDLERQDWRSFRLDRLSAPMGTRARFRRRDIPGGDAASTVRQGLSQRDRGQQVVATVHAPAEDVERRIGRWAQVAAIDAQSCRVEMDAGQPQWPLFALGVVRAPFDIETAPAELHAMLDDWSERFAAAAASRSR